MSTMAPRTPKAWSIGMKMDLVLVTLFILLLAASGLYQYTSQRGMVAVRNQIVPRTSMNMPAIRMAYSWMIW